MLLTPRELLQATDASKAEDGTAVVYHAGWVLSKRQATLLAFLVSTGPYVKDEQDNYYCSFCRKAIERNQHICVWTRFVAEMGLTEGSR